MNVIFSPASPDSHTPQKWNWKAADSTSSGQPIKWQRVSVSVSFSETIVSLNRWSCSVSGKRANSCQREEKIWTMQLLWVFLPSFPVSIAEQATNKTWGSRGSCQRAWGPLTSLSGRLAHRFLRLPLGTLGGPH